MDKICDEYNRVIGNMELEPLIAIPIFIHDFLCIHPFNDGNGRMSRLLTLLLLYRSGYIVGKYISLEKLIERTKDSYYDALQERDYNPVDQLVGYLVSGDPSYITSYNNARTLMNKLERDEILEELVTFYINHRNG